MVTHQSVAHLQVQLRASCILTVAVGVDSAAFHIAKSSTCRALEMCLERPSEMSFMKTTKRVGI